VSALRKFKFVFLSGLVAALLMAVSAATALADGWPPHL
jgi:hypothetical protein